MLERALHLLSTFLPAERRTDPVLRRKSLLLVALLLLVLASIPVNIGYQLLSERWLLLGISSATMVLYGGLLAAYRFRDIHRPASRVLLLWGYAGIFGTAMLSGGLYSSVTPLSAILPLVALSLQDRRAALAWTALTAVGIVALAAVDVVGLTPHGMPEDFERPFPYAVNLLLMLAYASGFAWFLESLNTLNRRQLEDQRRSADDANAAKSAFLANMSHELRTPMNGVLGLTEIVLLDEALPPPHRVRLQTVLQSGRALVDLLNDILDLSKVEAGQLVLESIPWNPRRIAQDVERLFGEVARRKGLDLRLVVEPDGLPAWVMGDPTRVRQVACNLVGNAVKFTESGSVVLGLSARDGVLVFEVTDSGPGIPPEVQARIFEPFTQADASMARRHGGTGLGLAICRRLTRLMDGGIHLESVLGEGSTFRVTLPYVETDAPASRADAQAAWLPPLPADPDPAGVPTPVPSVPPPTPRPTTGASPLAGARILVVEDVEVNQLVATTMLERLGCCAEVAFDGAEGYARILADPTFDAVLMDWHMPEMTGLEVTRLVRLAGHPLPIVGLTASVRPEDREAAITAGMDGFLGKPFTHEELERVLREVLGRGDRSG